MMTNKQHNAKCSQIRMRFRAAALLLMAGAAITGGGIAINTLSPHHAAAQAKKSKEVPKTATTPFEDHAAQAGIKTCNEVFSVLGSVMASQSSYRTATFWNQKQSNDHAVASIAGLSFDQPAFEGKGAGIVYGAPVGSHCEGISVRIVPLTQTCADFTKGFASDITGREDLNGTELLFLSSGAKVMTLPTTDKSCVVVTTMFANGQLE